MLVLARRVGEEVVIGGNVRMKIDRVHGDKIFLAFDAPKEVSIDRLEIHLSKLAERSSGSAAAGEGRT